MITGPSGFPVRRAEKASRSERKRSEEFSQFREKYFDRLERTRRRESRAASDPVAELRADITGRERLQIFFPGKPEPDMIARLKSNAFKWSPSRGCWQRQLTGNAKGAARRVLGL